jgi:DNA invertase Pin-like site-specific DNA recombinase
MLFGYARVSTKEQNLERQLIQLEKSGCQVIFTDKLSGKDMERKELKELLEIIKEGDEILVTDLTRITRSTRDLFELIDTIKGKGANLRSIKDSWLDTRSDNPYSSFLLTVMAGVNQLERELTIMRQREGIEIAKKKGRYKGRVKKYNEDHTGMKHALKLYDSKEYTIKEIEEITHVSKSALYRELDKRKGI